ncbi:MAG: hypothetical protein ACE5HI_10790 [bacterium]
MQPLKKIFIKKKGFSALTTFTVLSFIFTFTLNCASTFYRFTKAEPVTVYNDMKPIPVPHILPEQRAAYIYDVLVRRPAVKGFEITYVHPAKDVNSLDEVPASSWFTPRLGYKDISPQELLNGPEKMGPPQAPIKIIKAKSGGNPGFIIADARGKRYLIKFDPPEFPGIETTTALIVNRLYWGFGYNVPEDYLYYVRKEDLIIAPESDLTQEKVDAVLSQVAPPTNGRYRATVSLWLDGIVIGPIPPKGRRKDDLNDKIAHEDRRVLRGLRVFNAFVNHTDMRPDNTLDVYVGEEGKGYVRHYLIDFGEAFAGHGAEHDYLWDGFNHIFSFNQALTNLVTFGFNVQAWENIPYTAWKSVGAFESKTFKPEEWKEVYPYEPIRNSQAADNYWAVKIVGALNRDHLKILVDAADYPEGGAAEYMIETLMKRRHKVLEYFLNQVSAVDAVGFSNGELHLKDVGNILLNQNGKDTHYEIHFYNNVDKEISEKRLMSASTNQFTLPVSNRLMAEAGGYLRMEVWVWRGSEKAPSAAQFHFRSDNHSSWRLVGVVH